MRYRQRIDILSEILQIAQKEALQTKIMYGTNTSHTKIKEYLKQLIGKELLTYDAKEKTYHTTDKGIKFLKKYREMEQLLFSREPRKNLFSKGILHSS